MFACVAPGVNVAICKFKRNQECLVAHSLFEQRQQVGAVSDVCEGLSSSPEQRDSRWL